MDNIPENKQTKWAPITSYVTEPLSENAHKYLMEIAQSAGIRSGETSWWCHNVRCFWLSSFLCRCGRTSNYDCDNAVLIDFKQMESLIQKVRYNNTKLAIEVRTAQARAVTETLPHVECGITIIDNDLEFIEILNKDHLENTMKSLYTILQTVKSTLQEFNNAQ